MRGSHFLNHPARGALMVALTPPSAVPLVIKPARQQGKTEKLALMYGGKDDE